MSRDIGYGDSACYNNDHNKTITDVVDKMNITLADCDDFSKSEFE